MTTIKPVKISPQQALVLEHIRANDKVTKNSIIQNMSLNHNSASNVISILCDLGLIRKEQAPQGHFLHATDKAYKTGRATPEDYAKGFIVREPDLLLEHATTLELTQEQWDTIAANPGMPRTQLARLLKISKFDLNLAIDRIKNPKPKGK
ncbi:Winged helix DNA-binding domain-containing protein [Paenibacillus algorifonticola]|uniref:Winged helix DNA-binding domain-containing protein n=1 Tax=Paenibacillus algorifonticola TaxID=684063 RepID=A0A1I2AF47_9BACL|nr:winged helix DNA-binding protein [Paenibacillus algorifonticola]SFE42168.1 Winged helix DNA-binding domain-containing protein [Paenibacillus algorifonticola]